MSAEPIMPEQKIIEHPVRQDGVFDHRTHIRSSVSGKLVAHQPYATHYVGSQTFHERPIGSGNMFSQHGDPAGRWEMKDGQLAKVSEQHSDIPLRQEVRTVQDENAALRAEIEALKAETKAKTAPTKK